MAAIYILFGLVAYRINPIIGYDGLFHTDNVHNSVHIATGFILLYFALKTRSTNIALKFLGIVYMIIAVLGLIATTNTEIGKILNFLSVNDADNWLHLILGIVLLLTGIAVEEEDVIQI